MNKTSTMNKTSRLRTKPFAGLLGLVTLTALGLSAPAAQAQTAYVEVFGSVNGAAGETLGTLNIQTGLFTAINPLDNTLFALGFGKNGTLYGLGPDNTGGTNLYSVATATGVETLLQNFANYAVFGGSTGTDGIFTAITKADTSGHSSLFTVDPMAQTATGDVLTPVNADGLAVADGSGGVYISDVNNTSSGNDGLDFVNTTVTPPATTSLGDTGLQDVYTGFFSSGQLYTFGYDPATVDQAEGAYTLDTNTGAATLVVPTSDDEDIFAAALAPAAVPEASTTVSLGLLLALGLGSRVIAARKKKVASAV